MKITISLLKKLRFKRWGYKTRMERRTFNFKDFTVFKEPNKRNYYTLPTQCERVDLITIDHLKEACPYELV